MITNRHFAALLPLLQLVSGSVTCLKIGTTATATWKTDAGLTCKWTGVVGSNFGYNSIGSDYSCNGRCGAGCTGTAVGNVYTQDCFSHDICSYFNRATGGSSDVNCGNAYDAAVDDTALGAIYGCGQTNPSIAASVPTTYPACS
ncbi:hypothetical protein B0H66DRAFT_618708 [Apodospora peruviana]|uniref:DUF8213 domain-containing protein n=1 Tax=Apodospora peruviana TaxID=516989 RepID=A0AAE0M8C0_9PEZI|nr:hypothetical protein B0H66DRAFT_618708 [Apodospora peruviana]